MDETLKPCPFCGGEAVSVDGYYYEGDWVWPGVYCRDRQCGCEKQAVKWPCSTQDAITAWNTRADAAPTPKADEVEAVGFAMWKAEADRAEWVEVEQLRMGKV